MTDRTKHTCSRTGKPRLAVNCFCCALLIAFSVATNFARAAPLTRIGPTEEITNAWPHIWLAGTMPFTFGAPADLTEMQKTEWTVGIIAGLAGVCGHYGKVTEVRAFMKRSPYFRRGHSDVADWEDKLVAQRCGKHLSNLQKILGQKKAWEYYLGVTYPDEVTLPESPEKLSTHEQDRPYCNKRSGAQY